METPFELMYCLEKVAPFIHLPLYWADSTAIILGANQAFLDITGRHSLEEIRNKMPELCFPPSMANAIQEHIRQVVDSKQVQVSDQEIQEVGSKAKRYFTSTGSPVFDSEGRVFGVVVTTSELHAANVFPKNMPDINPLKNE